MEMTPQLENDMIGTQSDTIRHNEWTERPKLVWIAPKEYGVEPDSWTLSSMIHEPYQMPTIVCVDILSKIKPRKLEILELEDNWDEEGSKKIQPETFQRVERFIKQLQERYIQRIGQPLPIPSIFPGHQGEIELYWKKEDYSFVIDFPEDPESPVIFCAKNSKDYRIKGAIPDKNLLQLYFTFRDNLL